MSGTIRLWGHGSPKHDFLGKLIRRWERVFHRYQPSVRIVDDMYGSASGIGALYTGAGDLAILGEEISPAAERAFERERHYPPTRYAIATGSVDVNYFDYAHMIFVNRANPIDRLTVKQLDGVFGDEHRRGSTDIRTWGELGLAGKWAEKAIDPYGWRVDQDFALFFRGRVLEGSHRWNPAIQQFVTVERPDGTVDDRGEQILEALAHDPFGIAISNIRFANPFVKAVKLADTAAGPYLAATPRTLILQSYPLTRVIPAFIDKAPGRPLDPALREFLRFLLSREGQEALIEESGYLPLGASQARAELRELDGMRRCQHPSACRPAERVPRLTSPSRADEHASAPEAAAKVLDDDLVPSARSRLVRNAAQQLIRVWGHPALRALAQRWAQGFRASHPHVRIELHMSGSDTGMAALYTDEADIALLGRAATASELQAFDWVFRQPPARVEILRGSVGDPGRSAALQVLVAAGNPLRRIGLRQLRALFEARATSGVAPIRTWGQLGLTGPWATRPVRLYMADAESGTGRFFRDEVLSGSEVLDWPRITEIVGPAAERNRALVSAVARDPFGLAVASMPSGAWPVRPLAIAVSASNHYLRATRATVAAGTYPLGRPVYAYFNAVAGNRPLARAFIHYILGRSGRGAVRPDDGFLPVPEALARAQSAQLARSR